MFSFRAYFWQNDVYINEKYKYAAGEILTEYLNSKTIIHPDNVIYDLKVLKKKLLITEDVDYEWYENYNKSVRQAVSIFTEVDSLIRKLPPYNKLIPDGNISFEDILNSHSFVFDDGMDMFDSDNEDISWDTSTDYGYGDQSENGTWRIWLHTFHPVEPKDISDFSSDMRDSLNELNDAITFYIDSYLSFLKSYEQIDKAFRPFIENYLHCKETFLNANELAESFDRFNKENGNAFQKIKCHMKSFGYKVLKDENGKSILCEEISFADLQSFLFYDFWNGAKRNFVPNKCKHCGKYFLIRGGQYYSYCDRPIKKDPGKTCRDVGARRRYDDKCKNDPVWQTYNRAYKAHYARYMKKKMTVAEFEAWSRFASDLRDQALADKLPYEQYYTDIRK